MKQTINTIILVALVTIGHMATAQTRVLRAREMNSDQWSEIFKKGSEDFTVEFRQDDEIPVSFSAQGDLLETSKAGISYVQVKRTFWLKLQNKDVVLSLDGNNFKPLNQVVSGSFSAGAGSGQSGLPVNAIELSLRALLK